MAAKKKTKAAPRKKAAPTSGTARRGDAARAKTKKATLPKRCTPRGQSAARKQANKHAATRRMHVSAATQQAARLYERFHRVAPDKVVRVEVPADVAGAHVGWMTAIEYLTPDGQVYRHPFADQAQPKLIASADGRRLHIVGGRYRFTARGIVDR